MPITIVVRSGESRAAGREAPALTFDGTQRVVIGRGAGCDLRLPDTSVSARHASLQARGAEFVLVDEGSTNGTFVGGVRLSPRAPRTIRTGDLMRVGRVWLEVRIDAAPVTRDLANATRELALALVARAMEAAGDDTTARVRVVEGRDAGDELALAEEGRAYVVGRAADCDLPLADADASREHVSVVRRGSTVFVRDMGAKNGSWLGETELPGDRETVWKSTLMVRVGRTVLALDEPVASALQELEADADDVLPEGPAPAAPPSSAAPPAPAASASPEPAPATTPTAASDPAVPSVPSETSAPIASAPESPPLVASGAARGAWTVTDVLVMLAALAVLALSIAGLVWLLRS